MVRDKNKFDYYAIRTILRATKAIQQKLGGFVVDLRGDGLGIDSGKVYESEDLAVDAALTTLHTQFEKEKKVA